MDSTQSANILDRISLFRSFDEARHREIEEFAKEYQQMKVAFNNLQADLDDERQTRRKWRQQAEAADTAVRRNQFVLILIDGDGYLFNFNFFHNAEESAGAEAAHMLYTEVQNYLKANELLDTTSSDVEVVVNIYASKNGLARAMFEAEILHSQAQLDQFFWSFSQSHSLFQFIDCGPGKERADAKLRDTYRFYAYNVHCKYIFLACCHDNGYVAELDKYRHDEVAARKTFFIRHENTARQYANLPFPVARLGSLFESAPLPAISRSRSYQNNGLETSRAVNDNSPLANPEMSATSKVSSYSSIAAGTANAPTKVTVESISADGDDFELVRPNKSTSSDTKGIPVNKSGQRVDRKIQPPSNAELIRFDSRIIGRKLCNTHHLTQAGCHAYNCRYDHNPVDGSMRQTLRYKARSIPCSQGSQCRKLDCFYGHQCPWGFTDCKNLKCAFYKNGLHDIADLEIVKFVPAVEV